MMLESGSDSSIALCTLLGILVREPLKTLQHVSACNLSERSAPQFDDFRPMNSSTLD
jgi:hypothetical protein